MRALFLSLGVFCAVTLCGGAARGEPAPQPPVVGPWMAPAIGAGAAAAQRILPQVQPIARRRIKQLGQAVPPGVRPQVNALAHDISQGKRRAEVVIDRVLDPQAKLDLVQGALRSLPKGETFSVSGSAHAGPIGAGAFVEATRFHDGTALLYCGPSYVGGTNVEAAASGGSGIVSDRCNRENYGGGFLTFSLNGLVPAGIPNTYSVGLDEQKLARGLNVYLKQLREATPTPKQLAAVGNLFQQALRSLAQGRPDDPATRVLVHGAGTLFRNIAGVVRQSSLAIGDGMTDGLNQLRPAQPALDWKGVRVDPPDLKRAVGKMSEHLAEAERNGNDADRFAAGLLRGLVDILHGAMGECAAMNWDLVVSAGLLPASATMSFSYYSQLDGRDSRPLGRAAQRVRERFHAARQLARVTQPPVQRLFDERCAEPAAYAMCDAYQTLGHELPEVDRVMPLLFGVAGIAASRLCGD